MAYETKAESTVVGATTRRLLDAGDQLLEETDEEILRALVAIEAAERLLSKRRRPVTPATPSKRAS